MSIVPVKLKPELVKKLDLLVKIGKYKNRSDAIRKILTERIEREGLITDRDKEREQRIKHVVHLMKSKKGPVFELVSDKTASELIREGRER